AAGKIPGYRGPLLQSHGDADTIIPIEFGRRLFAAANEPKQFIAFADGAHNDLQPRGYYDELVKFLDGLE
ncbi:MAG: alpha/beta hydrolase, partial [Terriglobia bacterium]